MGKLVSLNLFGVINRLEAIKGHEITIRDVAKATGLNETGLYRAKNNQTNGADFVTLGKLLDYFNQEGLPDLTLEGLFSVVEKSSEETPAETVEGKALPAQVAQGEEDRAA